MTEQIPPEHPAAEDEIKEDPLVDRLRRLCWPDVPEEMRTKSWERFASMIEKLPSEPEPEASPAWPGSQPPTER
ncbi:MAG TPA: hypothetical protein VGN69_10565 [Solirubrobacteraceae bacterium]|nr:hypothetical protein [Solirubrobacteraceae bacterium]